MTFSNLINLPFTYLNTNRSKWMYILSSTVFCAVFLLLFRPFGLGEEFNNPINSVSDIAFFISSIAISVLIGLSLSQFYLRKLFHFERKPIKYYCCWVLFEVFILTLINFIFSLIIPDLGHDPIEEELNFVFQFSNFLKGLLILLFPLFGTVLYNLIENLNDEIKTLEGQILQFQTEYSLIDKAEQISIKNENNQIELTLALNDFLFVESSSQYVLIYYIENKEIKKEIIRTRLKHLIESFESHPIEQCHRSYVVNLINVKRLLKREGKTFLIMDEQNDIKVPVSKSYLENIKQHI